MGARDHLDNWYWCCACWRWRHPRRRLCCVLIVVLVTVQVVQGADEAQARVRCDSGVFEGSEISMHYDPMISKLITFADAGDADHSLKSRQQAIDLMNSALDHYVIRGLNDNVRAACACARVYAQNRCVASCRGRFFADRWVLRLVVLCFDCGRFGRRPAPSCPCVCFCNRFASFGRCMTTPSFWTVPSLQTSSTRSTRMGLRA